MPPHDEPPPPAPSVGPPIDPGPAPEAPPGAPFQGLGLAVLGLVLALPGLLAILFSILRGRGASAWLWLLLCAGLLLCYGGLWRILAASTPRPVLRGLALGLAALLGAAWGLGAPGWMLALALLAVALLLLGSSGPILFSAWVERTDAEAERRRRD